MPRKQDIAILGDRIAQLGEIAREEGREVIEAEGLVASPGWIDLHTHSDFNPFVYPNLGNKVLQGVTTEVVGNCGMSAAPVFGRHTEEIGNIWRREGVEIPREIPWKTYREYVSELKFQGLETNFIGLVGHGNLRSAVMGMEARAARGDELKSMKRLLREALDDGASGISFGLTYLPGVFASREELVALCRQAARRKGICAFHIRSEGSGLIEAVEEAIRVGEAAGAPLHISHLKAAGQKHWPKIQAAFEKIEKARSRGVKVTADAYPYDASFAELGVVLPDSIYQDPGRVERLRDPVERPKILEMLQAHYQANPVSWDRIRIATVTHADHIPFRGKSLLALSQEKGKPPEEVLVDLLALEEFKVSAFYFSQSEEVVNQVFLKPYVGVGSDSIADGSALPHPRAYGTFPKILARCAKEGPVTQSACWGRAIHQMTGLAARILGLRERGRIGTGRVADLVLFDPLAIRDRADYENPKVPPEGIHWVFVNGKSVVREGKYQPVHSGLFVEAGK